MKIQYIPKHEYKSYECTTYKKICLDICDTTVYGETDSNFFYKLYYINLDDIYNKTSKKLGLNIYKDIFSYQILCQMICVELPKSYYNIKPFKLKYFEKCCKYCKRFMLDNDINTIYTPIFGTEILEGNWKEILDVMNSIFINDSIYVFK
jgi:hypothetical protein